MMSGSITDMDTEIRYLKPAEFFKLSQILNMCEGWKKLMAYVPGANLNEPRFISEHFRLIEEAAQRQKRGCAEIFLEEWGTKGRKRPTIRNLLDLLIKTQLFRAADFIAMDVLNQKKGPERPRVGPAAPVDILDSLSSISENRAPLSIPDSSCTEDNTTQERSDSYQIPKFLKEENISFSSKTSFHEDSTPEQSSSMSKDYSCTSLNNNDLKSENDFQIGSQVISKHLPRCLFMYDPHSNSNCESSDVPESENLMEMDFSTVPLFALSSQTKVLISTLLNPRKVIPTDNGLPSDWRGLAHLLGITGQAMPSLESHSDPCERILQLLQEEKVAKITFKDLQIALESIDRWDVIDDTETLLRRDAQEYLSKLMKSQTDVKGIVTCVNSSKFEADDFPDDYCKHASITQYYDAFLLYADEDFTFAQEVIEKLEAMGLKLCTKDRDLITSGTFEHEVIMQVISDKCSRLIVIISPNFLKSPLNEFLISYAQAISIDKRQSKLIPCIYKECQLPSPLLYLDKLFYSRRNIFDFWGKFYRSVRRASDSVACTSESNSIPSSISKNMECSKSITSASFSNDEREERKNPLEVENGEEKKNGVVLSSPWLLENPTKTVERSGDSCDGSKSDSAVSLPSVPSSDTADLLPIYSANLKKKSKTKFLKKLSKVHAFLKS